MNKLKLFLSSRVNSAFVKLDPAFTLTDLRQYLREQLEQEVLFGENIFEVVTNETSFKGDFTKDAFDNCLATMRSCHIIIILYNGEAGWSPEEVHVNGICHEEYLVAVESFSGMTWALDLTNYFSLPDEGPEKEKNDAFRTDVEDYFRHMEKISKPLTVDELKQSVLTQIKGYILDAMEKSFRTRKEEVLKSGHFGATLDWSKLTYRERAEQMQEQLMETFNDIPAFRDVILDFHCIPDNMSVADARNMIGRPFIEEHERIKQQKKKSGVIHFVAVYGSATEMQVKNLVGYPDLTVIKSTFGCYLWEKNSHIQMFFITKCINPQTIKTRLSQLLNWLDDSREKSKIVVRSKARYSILDAMNTAATLKGLN